MKKLSTFTCSVVLAAGLTLVGVDSCFAAAAAPAWDGSASTTTMVIQSDAATGVKYYIYRASDVGSSAIPFPIGTGGATFELWLKGTPPDNTVYWADRKVVNAYMPTATFTINSEDPWVVGSSNNPPFIRRTRADKGYSYSLNVDALLAPGAGVPVAASGVRLDRKGLNYFVRNDYVAPGGAEPQRGPYTATDGASVATEYAIGLPESITANGAYDRVFGVQGLTPSVAGGDPTMNCGEERLVVTRYASLNPDGSVFLPDTIIGAATIQVFPVASSQISGVVAGQVYSDEVPVTSVRYQDIYPDSITYCQIYTGSQVLGTVGTVLAGSERAYGSFDDPPTAATATPNNEFIPDINLNAHCLADGTYTLEVITKTPFNNKAAERLAYVTFSVAHVVMPPPVAGGGGGGPPVAVGSSIRGQITTGR
jgi:hypothetical protein